MNFHEGKGYVISIFSGRTWHFRENKHKIQIFYFYLKNENVSK